MSEMLKKLFVALVGLLFAASLGTAYAASPGQSGYTGDTLQQTQPPKDCKKNPNDPRCKDEK
ncbi:MAG: hypothetical protein HYS35_00235 [Betaproteobacteria bacterium]|nr:hypothetical protein [Betaproteobacteria bacterium]